MNLRHLILAATLAATSFTLAEEGYEELTRGPVHEAFATSVNFDPEPGIIVRVAPPSPIEEVPPDQQPVGENISWIPGYWGWDEELSEHLWISGVWRNLPPGRQWVPGYWAETGSEWQWTSGYWADEETEEIVYLPKPPKTIEAGPNVEAPSKNHFWVSGNWDYRDDRYAWRPGYWEQGQQNWGYVPSHYQWTRRGYVYIDGFWDYNVARRGTVFAPVRFRREYYSRPNYRYTPSTVISLGVFATHLFVRPNYGHYYFGDYYEPRYRDSGYVTSYSYSSGRRGYDPIYSYNRWENRDDRDWDRKRRDDYDYYRDNEAARPPRTFAALLSRVTDRNDGRRDGDDRRDNFVLAEPLTKYVDRRDDGDRRQRFQVVTEAKKEQIVEQRQEVRKFREERQRIETPTGEKSDGQSDKPTELKREKLTRSPLVSKKTTDLSGEDAPPKRPERTPRGDKEPGQDANRKNPAEPGKPDDAVPGSDPKMVPGEPGKPGPDADRKPDGPPGDTKRDPRRERPGAPDNGKKDDPAVVPGDRKDGKDMPNKLGPGTTDPGTPGGKKEPDAVRDPVPGTPEKGNRDRRDPPADRKPNEEKRKSDPAPTPAPANEPKERMKTPAPPEPDAKREPRPEPQTRPKVDPPQRQKAPEPDRPAEPKMRKQAEPDAPRRSEPERPKRPDPEPRKAQQETPKRESSPERNAPDRPPERRQKPEAEPEKKQAPQPQASPERKERPQARQAEAEKREKPPERNKEKEAEADSKERKKDR